MQAGSLMERQHVSRTPCQHDSISALRHDNLIVESCSTAAQLSPELRNLPGNFAPDAGTCFETCSDLLEVLTMAEDP